MKIKVCGMKYPDNIKELAGHIPDYMGFIFYEKSPRFAGTLDPRALAPLVPETKRVGVFVNAGMEYIQAQVSKYGLDLVQLHGDETPEFCALLQRGIPVIKAFGISTAADLKRPASYTGSCDYFLFDTKTPRRGGSGQKFDHTLLSGYRYETPYFLSGGIGPDDMQTIQALNHPRCIAVDINSRFETEPGRKDAEAAGRFIRTTRRR